MSMGLDRQVEATPRRSISTIPYPWISLGPLNSFWNIAVIIRTLPANVPARQGPSVCLSCG